MIEDPIPKRCKPKEEWLNDLHLCREIASGSLASWHQFITQYSNLIFNIVRRHMFVKDEDDLRNVFVDILEKIYHGDIARYRGESSLSTWLVVYTRCKVVDYTRKRFGRHRKPRGYNQLTDFDKSVFQYYFADRLPLSIVIHSLCWSGFTANATDIVESVERIHKVMGKRYLKKLETEQFARELDMDPSQMTNYLVNLRNEYSTKINNTRPDSNLIRQEAEEMAEQVRSALSYLTSMERKIIFFHFHRSWSARRIAEKLGMNSHSTVYYSINKIINKLKNSLQIDEK